MSEKTEEEIADSIYNAGDCISDSIKESFTSENLGMSRAVNITEVIDAAATTLADAINNLADAIRGKAQP